MRLEDVLKKLNKDRKDLDKISVLGDSKLERFVVSTGSPYIDYKIGGGWVGGSYNCIIAEGGSGKSSLALLACKNIIEDTGKTAVYFDGEGTLNDSYIDRMGVDRNRLIIRAGRNLETMLDEAELFATSEDVGIIVIDSIPIFTSSVVEDKSASDSTMSVEARKYASRMPIIEGYCMNRKIVLLGLTSYRLDPGAMGDPRRLTRGQWQYTMSNVTLELTRKEFITDSTEDFPIGHRLDVRVKKSKTNSYNPKEVFSVDFYYQGGFNQTAEFARLLSDKGVIKQSGAWYSFADSNGEEVRLQGINAVINHLTINTEDFENLKSYL